MSDDDRTLRKRLISKQVAALPSTPVGEDLDLASIATVLLTSEAPGFPIENVLDEHRGPGGTRWVASTPGEQALILQFDAPQSLREIVLEVEELDVCRTQVVELFVSCDGGHSYREVSRQEYNFSPPGTTYEREVLPVRAEGVTHLRVGIRPDKAGRSCHASLISLALR